MFTLASLACGLAASPVLLVAARVAQGSAAALMFPQALTGIQLHFTGLVRVRAIGRYAIALSAGAVTGQILGGALISANLAGTGWRAIFLINVPVGVLVLRTDSHWLPADDRRASRSLDVPGVAALSVAVLLLVLPLTLGQAEGWPGWAWACMAASVPAFAVFLSVERRAAARGGSPLVNVTVLARPPVAWALLTLVMTTGSYYALLFTLAQYPQTGLADSALSDGHGPGERAPSRRSGAGLRRPTCRPSRTRTGQSARCPRHVAATRISRCARSPGILVRRLPGRR